MFEKRYLGNRLTAVLMLLAVAAVAAISGNSYLKMRNPAPEVDRLVPQEGFERRMLSDWFDGLRDTPADTPVFVQEGAEPGGTVLVLGGTHANVPAGVMAAVVMLENAFVERGRMIFEPYDIMMARTHTFPLVAHPLTFGFKT